MKKMIKNLMLVAVAAMAFVGCQNDNDEMNVTARKVVLNFVAGFDEDTRATFGEKNGNTYPTYWDGREWVSVTISDGENDFRGSGRVELPEGEETSLTAKISVEFYLEEDQTLPAAGTITATVGDFDFETGEVVISDEQQPMENAPESLPLISTNEYTNANITGEPLAFKHAAAYGKMTIPQLAGINTDKVVVSFNEGAYKYTIRTSNAGDEGVLWFACPAFDVTDFTVSFVESGVFSYTKSVESLAEGALKFQVGRISAFTVNDIEKEELTPEVFEVFSTMEYLGDSTWKFSNANGYFMTIPFTTAVGDTLVDGVYTGAAGPTDEEFKYVVNDARFVYADNTLELTYDQGTWVTTGGVVTVETVDEQTIVSFIGYLCDPTDYTSFLYQGVYDPTFVPSAVEILKVSGDYYDPSKYTNLWIDVAMSAGENYSIFLPLTVGEDGEPFAVIPEGVYTVGAETGKAIGAEAHANAESADPYVGLKEGTLTVSHVGEEYNLVLNLTNNNDEVFDLEWQGTIGGYFAWSNEFPHPGYVVTLDAPENVVATVENRNSIVVTWDAVANAVSYTVSCSGQDDQVVDAESELTATFTGLEYDTEYTITVVANAAADSVYADSEASTATATTLVEQAAVRNLTFTSATKTGGDLSYGYVGITFATDAGDSFYLEYNMIDSTIGGTFSGSIGGVAPGTIYAATLTPNGGDSISALDGEVVVVDENPDFEFEMNFNLSDGSTLVATYEGEVDGVSVSAPVEFVSAEAVFQENDPNWYIVNFTDADDNVLKCVFGNGNVNYLNEGTWSTAYWYSSGFGMNPCSYNDEAIDGVSVVVAYVDGDYSIQMTWNTGSGSFKGQITGFTVPGAAEPEPEPEPEPDSIVLTTITPLNETFDPDYYTWSFNFTDGTDNNKFAIAFYYNKASATSIVPGEYTFASSLSYVNAPNFALDARTGNPYYFEGINKKLTTGSTVNVAVDGSVYTINMHFILTDGSEHDYKYVGEIVVEEPETLATPTNLVATATANTVTVSWDAVANATSYYVTCGDKSQTVHGNTTTTATFDGLEAGTTYNISVVAKAEGEGYVDSPAATTTVTTEDAGGEGGEGGGEAKQVSLTFFMDNGTSYIFKGNDGHNYLIALRNFTPGTFSLTDSSKFITTGCTWTENNTTYFGGTQFAEGDTLELINLGTAFKIIIRATVAGEPVVATCESTTFS